MREGGNDTDTVLMYEGLKNYEKYVKSDKGLQFE